MELSNVGSDSVAFSGLRNGANSQLPLALTTGRSPLTKAPPIRSDVHWNSRTGFFGLGSPVKR